MRPSLIEANERLDAVVSRGGSWWVGWSTTLPDEVYSPESITLIPGLALVELPRDGAATWEAASGARVQPLAGLSFGTLPAGTDYVPMARVFFDGSDPATANVMSAARCADVTVYGGQPFVCSPAALALDSKYADGTGA